MSENTTTAGEYEHLHNNPSTQLTHAYHFGPLQIPTLQEFAKQCVTYAVRDYDTLYISPMDVYLTCMEHANNSLEQIDEATIETLFAEELLSRKNAVTSLLRAQPSTKEDIEVIHSTIIALTKKIDELSATNSDLTTHMQHARRIALSAYAGRIKLESEYLMLKARIDLMYSMKEHAYAYARQSRWLGGAALIAGAISNILFLAH
jgi:hypothetical protein